MPSEGVSMCMGEDMSMCILERVCVSVQGGGCEHCVWERMCVSG